MTRSEKIDAFYEEFRHIHRMSFPTERAGQVIFNFTDWLKHAKGMDIFFLEEDKLLEHFKEYANACSLWYRGWDAPGKQE